MDTSLFVASVQGLANIMHLGRGWDRDLHRGRASGTQFYLAKSIDINKNVNHL